MWDLLRAVTNTSWCDPLSGNPGERVTRPIENQKGLREMNQRLTPPTSMKTIHPAGSAASVHKLPQRNATPAPVHHRCETEETKPSKRQEPETSIALEGCAQEVLL